MTKVRDPAGFTETKRRLQDKGLEESESAFRCCFLPKSKNHNLTLFFCLLETVVIVILSIVQIQKDLSDRSNYLAAVIIASAIFFFYFAVDGIIKSNLYEMIAVISALVFTLIFVIFRFFTENRDTIAIIGLTVVVVIDLLLIPLFYKFFKNFNVWRILKLPQSLKEEKDLRDVYRNYEAFSATLKLDVFFGVMLVIMGIWFFFVDALEIILEMIAIFVTFAWAILGNTAVRVEAKNMMIIFFLFSIAAPINIVWKGIELIKDFEGYDDSTIPFYQIMFIGVVALIVRILLIKYAIQCRKNFGKQLFEEVFEKEHEEQAESLKRTLSVMSIKSPQPESRKQKNVSVSMKEKDLEEGSSSQDSSSIKESNSSSSA